MTSFVSRIGTVTFTLSTFLRISLLVISLPSASSRRIVASISTFAVTLSREISTTARLTAFTADSGPLMLSVLVSISILPVAYPSGSVPFLATSMLNCLVFLFSTCNCTYCLSEVIFSTSRPLLNDSSIGTRPSSVISDRSAFAVTLCASIALIADFGTRTETRIVSELSTIR